MTGRVGAIAWLVGAAQFLIVQLVVGAEWATSYSWTTNNISDLGNVDCGIWDQSRPRYVCSPLHAVMNASFIAEGILLLVGAVLTTAYWGRTAKWWTARALLAVSAIGWIIVGLAPADIDENRHLFGALLIMGLGNIGLVCAGFLPRTASFGRAPLVTRALAAAAVLSTVMFFAGHGPLIGMGGTERVAAFACPAWTVVAAAIALRRQLERTTS
ncbi:DUF998 domain-containing protein [Nocardia lijiangensis]|uniref:DUF998 domain-containing protein n=1 Tax=Nocardia lijiangensis TaxID=299618 RepID=UPI000829F8BB|nr:DUF998 domain-containing protein [Nocardia lijiangensis]